jgi:hypothetical protein
VRGDQAIKRKKEKDTERSLTIKRKGEGETANRANKVFKLRALQSADFTAASGDRLVHIHLPSCTFAMSIRHFHDSLAAAAQKREEMFLWRRRLKTFPR